MGKHQRKCSAGCFQTLCGSVRGQKHSHFRRVKMLVCGRKQQPSCIAATQASVNAAQSGAHEISISKMTNLLSQDKGSFVSFRYACGFVGEAVFGRG